MIYKFCQPKERQVLRNHLKLGGSNPEGGTIDITSVSLERDGKPWIPVMGEIHFSRVKRSEWQTELCKMKAGGITLAATYLFWIYHEETEGKPDFTGNNDIRAFVLECRRAGLDIVLRVGPWVHGECRNGGLPDWLLKKPYKLRDNNAEYLAQVERWFRAIAEETKGLYYKDGGNIVAVQLENEYCHDAEHLAELKKLAIKCGLDVPLYTVTGWNSVAGAKIPVDEVFPLFGGYCERPWDQHTEPIKPVLHYFFSQIRNDSAIGADLMPLQAEDDWQLPYERYPFATCELGGGMQVTHHRRPIVKAMDTYAMSLVKIGDGSNLPGYYMYRGGTNAIGEHSTFQESKASGYPNDYSILSYDFQAPLSEFGEVRESYRLLNLLHLFLQDFEESFAPMQAVAAASSVGVDDVTSLRYGMRSDGKSGYVFINHYQRMSSLEDVRNVVIDTGEVVFPEIDVCGDIAFFMPYNMQLGNEILKWATAQPLCRDKDTYFFAQIPGIMPRYCFADDTQINADAGIGNAVCRNGIKIYTLTYEQAKYLRKLDGKIYIGEGCDLFLCEGRLQSAAGGEYSYAVYDGCDFTKKAEGVFVQEAVLTVSDVDAGPFVPRFAEQLSFGYEYPKKDSDSLKERRISWKRLEVSSDKGFVTINEAYDVAQIYADGELVADNFYHGLAWRVPAALLAGKECYLVMSELWDDFYREF